MKYDVNDFSRTIPGDVFFVRTHLPGAATIKFGQMWINDDCRWHHTGISVGANSNGSDCLFEARPPEARIVPIDSSVDSVWYRLPLTDNQRDQIREMSYADLALEEIKYGWSNYAYLGLLRMGINLEWLKTRIANSSRRICSQLVDDLLTRVNYHVLDGVSPGQVSPGDLQYRFSNDRSITPFRLDGRDPWYWDGK